MERENPSQEEIIHTHFFLKQKLKFYCLCLYGIHALYLIMHESHNAGNHGMYMYSPKVIKTKKLTKVSGSFPYYKIDFPKILETQL